MRNHLETKNDNSHEDEPGMAKISRLPMLVLTVFYNKQPVHIHLDSGAESDYVRLDFCKRMNIPIQPNNTLSVLGDSKTKIRALGEIDITLNRDSWSVRLQALVVKDLTHEVFGGQPFHWVNDIRPAVRIDEIIVQGRHRIFATDMKLPLPTADMNTLAPFIETPKPGGKL